MDDKDERLSVRLFLLWLSGNQLLPLVVSVIDPIAMIIFSASGCAIICEWFVFPSGKFRYLTHIGINDIGNRFIEFVYCFLGLEEDIRILGSTSGYRMFRIQSIVDGIS